MAAMAMLAWLVATWFCVFGVHGQANTFTDVVSNPHMPSNFDGMASADMKIGGVRYTVIFGGMQFKTNDAEAAGQECQETQYSDKV